MWNHATKKKQRKSSKFQTQGFYKGMSWYPDILIFWYPDYKVVMETEHPEEKN